MFYTCLWFCSPGHTPAPPLPRKMATAADGTRPTGIHSCLLSYLLCNCDELQWIVMDTLFNLQGFFLIALDPSLFHL